MAFTKLDKEKKEALKKAPQQVRSTNSRKTISMQIPMDLYLYLKELKEKKMINSTTLMRELLIKYKEENPL